MEVGRCNEGLYMNWGEWLEHDVGSLDLWKQAAKGVSRRFNPVAGRKVNDASAKRNERAYWMLIHKPLDGVRLLAVRLHYEGNFYGHIELRIWSYAAMRDVWLKFEVGPPFAFNGRSFVPYTCAPQDSWKSELEREGVEVRGRAFSGRLADVGEPEQATAVIRALFEEFCEFVLKRYQSPASESMDEEKISSPFHQLKSASPPEFFVSAGSVLAEGEEDRRILEFQAGLSMLTASEREAVVKIRVGQSLFRKKLMSRWNSACSITGLASADVLIASHIKRWSDCDSIAERWDVNNGLLLTPSLDKAFELGLIGFEHEGSYRGRLVVSSRASWDLKDKLKLDNPQWRIREWHQGLTPYLLHHRKRWSI